MPQNIQLIEWIKKSFSYGQSETNIFSNLMISGYDPDVINQSILAAKQSFSKVYSYQSILPQKLPSTQYYSQFQSPQQQPEEEEIPGQNTVPMPSFADFLKEQQGSQQVQQVQPSQPPQAQPPPQNLNLPPLPANTQPQVLQPLKKYSYFEKLKLLFKNQKEFFQIIKNETYEFPTLLEYFLMPFFYAPVREYLLPTLFLFFAPIILNFVFIFILPKNIYLLFPFISSIIGAFFVIFMLPTLKFLK